MTSKGKSKAPHPLLDIASTSSANDSEELTHVRVRVSHGIVVCTCTVYSMGIAVGDGTVKCAQNLNWGQTYMWLLKP